MDLHWCLHVSKFLPTSEAQCLEDVVQVGAVLQAAAWILRSDLHSLESFPS